MAGLCSCSSGGGNLGRPSCYEVFGTAKKLIFMEYFKPDGSVNGIDVSTLTGGKLDQTFLDARVKDVNPRTRWYPSPKLVSVTDVRVDDTTEEIDNTTTIFIEQGVRAFEGFTIKGDPVFVGNMNAWKCLTAGVMSIDKDGNLQGAEIVSGFLYPVRLQDESLSATLIKTSVSGSTGSKTQIKFAISELEKDSNLKMLEAVDITADLLGVRGLVDINAVLPPSAQSLSSITVQINTDYGGITNPAPAEGLAITDFEMNEISPIPGPIVITTVTENPLIPGEYLFTFPAQTALDVVAISNPAVGPLAKNFDLNTFNVTL